MGAELRGPARWTLSLVGLEGRASPGQGLALDPAGRPAVAWTQGPPDRPRAVLSTRAPTSARMPWITREVHPDAADSDEPAIVADLQGALHLCWVARSSPGGARWLLYARSEDGGARWGAPEVLQDPRRHGAAAAPQLGLDVEGRLHVAWHTRPAGGLAGGQVWWCCRAPGEPFGPAVALGGPDASAHSARFAAQGSGRPVAVAWLDGRDGPEGQGRDELYLGQALGGGGGVWEQRVTFGGEAEAASALVDRDGGLHLVWRQRSNGDICYMQSPDRGRQWHDGGGYPSARALNQTPGREPVLAPGHHPHREVLWLAWLQDGGEAHPGARDGVMLALSPNGGAEWAPAGHLARRGHGQRLSGLTLRVGFDCLPRLLWTAEAPGATAQLWLAVGEP